MAFDATPQPAKPTHLQGNARQFLKSLGYTPSDWCGPRSAKDLLHDTCWHCTNCDDWFASKSEMAEEEDQPEYGGLCFYCRWNYLKPGEQASRVAA